MSGTPQSAMTESARQSTWEYV